jgi:hypothetical protein
MQKIKIYGERHTSSNYLSRLIELNLEVEELPGTAPKRLRTIKRFLGARQWLRDRHFARTFDENLGWKHMLVASAQVIASTEVMARDGVAILTLTKNPYSWLQSMYRSPYHIKARDVGATFEHFLQRPWRTLGRENAPSVVENPVQLWNCKNAALMALPANMALHLTTEQTILEPEATMTSIADRFAIARKPNFFTNFEASTKNRPGQDGAYYRQYYADEVWREKLSAESVHIINEQVDQTLMYVLGYEVI